MNKEKDTSFVETSHYYCKRGYILEIRTITKSNGIEQGIIEYIFINENKVYGPFIDFQDNLDTLEFIDEVENYFEFNIKDNIFKKIQNNKSELNAKNEEDKKYLETIKLIENHQMFDNKLFIC